MIDTLNATQFHSVISSGKTKPARLVCEDANGRSFEVVAKLSAACEQGVMNLAAEAVGACLAADLGLPVPCPYAVQLDAEFIDEIPNDEWRERARASSPLAFGSTVVPAGFRQWTTADRISQDMVAEALAIFTFDALTFNPDRRSANPNCFVRGDALRVFDHELSFSHRVILFWRPPWQMGSLHSLETDGAHIFRSNLQRRPLDLAPVRAAWAAISDERLEEYRRAVPLEWAAADGFVDAALSLISSVRDNIDDCLVEVGRVLR